MHIELNIGWRLDSTDIDPVVFALLEAIQQHGSLQRACSLCGVSYRHAWGLLRKLENSLATSLVIQRRGRGGGTTLSESGQAFLHIYRDTQAQLQDRLHEVATTINGNLAEHFGKRDFTPVNVCASSDLIIHKLSELLDHDNPGRFVFATRGSIESLRQLKLGNCEIAGIHLPTGRRWRHIHNIFKPWLQDDCVRLMIIATRRQGILYRKGSKISGLANLCKRSISFINRQPDSGTRILFDELLRQEQIKCSDIRGYNNVEYSHLAVAGMVSSGDVDAGFGIESAASKFRLDFLPLVEEVYLLACTPESCERHADTILACIESTAFGRQAEKLTGYDLQRSGELIQAGELYG